MPTPTPTDTQVETTREIMGENSLALVAALVAAGNDAQWAATLDDVDEWLMKVRGHYARLNGRVILNPADRAYAIRVRVRTRYGLTEQIGADVLGGYGGSCAVPVEVWP